MLPTNPLRAKIPALLLAAAVGAGCRPSAKSADSAKVGTAITIDPHAISPFDRDTGRVIARGESKYAVIKNDTCPGTRVVNSRFQAAQDLVVLLTENNTSLDCQEGIRGLGLVLVWHADHPSSPPDTIHAYGSALSIVGGSLGSGVERSVPLVEAYEQGLGIGAEYRVYYSLRTRRQLFMSEPPILTFAANGTRRYIAVRGGDNDTLAVVEYGSGAEPPQVLRMIADGTHGAGRGGLFQVDTAVSLDGPRRDGEIVVGSAIAKDTVPVSGVTLRFRVGEMSAGADDPRFSYVVRIVNDRLVLENAARPK